MAIYNMGPGNDLLPDDTKPLPEPMLSYDTFCGIYLSAISQEVLILIRIMCSETRLPYLPGANELINLSQEQNGRKPLDDNFKNTFFNQFSAANLALAGFFLTNALGENLPSRH